MKLQINTDHNIQGREKMIQQAEATVESTLGHLAEHITRVEVHLSDENGKKAGSHDKRCMMEARLEGHQPIAVTRMRLKERQRFGYKATFNPTFPVRRKQEYGWVSPYHFGINQGPIVIMIENHRTGFMWSLMRQCSYLVKGLRRAGFTGGWLD